MLLLYGRSLVDENWEVIEKTAAGFIRVYYVYKGYVEYIDDSTKLILKHDHLYIFPTLKPYTMLQDPMDRLECIYFHLDVLPALADELIEIDVNDFNLMKHILMTINAGIDEGNNKVIESMIQIFESYCEEKGFISDIAEPFSNILKYISKNLHKQMMISDLCRIAGYNEQYFIRLFKKKTGSSPHQYIISQRMSNAKRLIIKGMTISQTAKETGYNDIKTFSRAFKTYFGVPPSYYRKTSIIKP